MSDTYSGGSVSGTCSENMVSRGFLSVFMFDQYLLIVSPAILSLIFVAIRIEECLRFSSAVIFFSSTPASVAIASSDLFFLLRMALRSFLMSSILFFSFGTSILDVFLAFSTNSSLNFSNSLCTLSTSDLSLMFSISIVSCLPLSIVSLMNFLLFRRRFGIVHLPLPMWGI